MIWVQAASALVKWGALLVPTKLRKETWWTTVTSTTAAGYFAAPLVRPGGLLVYATCALVDREGRDQVAAFLGRHEGWIAEPIDLPVGRAHGDGLLLTPGHDGSDGFYFARLRRQA